LLINVTLLLTNVK